MTGDESTAGADPGAKGTVGKSCPYCRFPIKDGVPVVSCPTCGAVHHADCWAENSGCAVTGCASGPETASSATGTDGSATAATPAVAATGGHADGPPHGRRWIPWVAAIVVLVVIGAGAFVASRPSSAARHDPVSLTVSSPSSGTSTSPGALAVTGSVSPADAKVEVNGSPAHVGSGKFVALINVARGANKVVVVASASGAAPETKELTVTGKAPESPPGRRGHGKAPSTQTTREEGGEVKSEPSGPESVSEWTETEDGYHVGPGCSDSPSSSLPGCADSPNSPNGEVRVCRDGTEVDAISTTCQLGEDLRGKYSGAGEETVTGYSSERNAEVPFTCHRAGVGTTGYTFCLASYGGARLYARWR